MSLKVNLGCGRNVLPDWMNIDKAVFPGVVYADLEACRTTPLPLQDNSVDTFFMSHTIEHITDTLALMQETHRAAKLGALMTIRCPYGSSDDADEDPTHVRRYFLQSFGYFSQPYYWRADYGYRGDWQPEYITLIMDKAFEQIPTVSLMQLINRQRNMVQEMVAILRAVKPIREPDRSLQVQPTLTMEFR